MYNYFISQGFKLLLILTKSDKLSNNQKFKQKKLIKESLKLKDSESLITYSTKTKENHDLIWQKIMAEIEI